MSNSKQVNNSCVSAFHSMTHSSSSSNGHQQKHSENNDTLSVVSKQDNQNAAVLSSAEALVKLLNRTMYPIVQENGQRRYGPPPDWKGFPPRRGCEVFIGKIPRDCFEDELVPVFERIGPIYMFRLMMDFTGTNRGYGFCIYMNREDTKRAVSELNNFEIRRDKPLGVCLSVDNCRLFVGGIPKNKTKEEIFVEMVRVTEGVKDVIAYPSVADKTKNRGFAFVEYESHKAAAMARRKLIPGRIQLWGQQIAVDWAEPEREVNEEIMSTVKILYVRNLMLTTTEETIREKFVAFSNGPPDCVERVKKIKDYAFVHFKDRNLADNALKALNNTQIDSSWIEVNWAKPADKTEPSKVKAVTSNGDPSSSQDLFQQSQIFIDSSSGISYIGAPISTIHSQNISSSSSSPNRIKSGRRNAAGYRSVTISRERKVSETGDEGHNSDNWTNSHQMNKCEWMVNGVKYQYIPTQIMYPSVSYAPNITPVAVGNTYHEEVKSAMDYSGSQNHHNGLNEESTVVNSQMTVQSNSSMLNPNIDQNSQPVYVVNPIQQFQGFPNSAFQITPNQPMTYSVPGYYPQMSHSFQLMAHQPPQMSTTPNPTLLNQSLPAYGPASISMIPMAINQIPDYSMNTAMVSNYGLDSNNYMYANQMSSASNSNGNGPMSNIPTILPIAMSNNTAHLGAQQTLLNTSLLQSCGATIS